MEGYEPLTISGEQLKALARSEDYNDRIMAAAEIRTRAESNRLANLEIDVVVTCVPGEPDGDNAGIPVRCFSIAAGEICSFVVPPDKPYGAWAGSMIRQSLGGSLLGRLVLVSEDGQLLWQEESAEVRSVLKTLASDTDQHVLVATVAALVALTAADDSELSGLAIEELHRLVLRGAVPDVEIIAEAFEAIRIAAERGSKPAVDVFIESLWHDTCKVRLFAVVGLEAPAKSGNERALAALLRGVCDAEPQVRQVSLDGLGSVLAAVEKGHASPRAALAAQVDTLLEMLECDRSVCAEIVVALGAAAGNGHVGVLQKLLELSQHSEEFACSAVRGLGLAAMRGSSKIFETLSSLAASSEDDGIRLQAVSSMGAMLQDGHAEVAGGLAKVATSLDDPNLFVRLEAIRGLRPAVAAGDEAATAALLHLMEQSNKMIRRAVVEVIAAILSNAQVLQLFRLEESGLVAAVIRWQSDDDSMIRRDVVSCLSSLNEKGNAAVESSLIRATRDCDEHVRRAAVRRLGELAQVRNEQAAEAVLACAEDCSSLVRAEVAACTAALAKLGHFKAMELLPGFEEHSNILVSVAAQPGTSITTTVGDSSVSMMSYSYEASRLIHHGLGAAAVPMLHAAVVPGTAVPQGLRERNTERAITDAVQDRLANLEAGIS